MALDLCCGAGGATRGLQNAGFHVTGVDLVRSPRYVGDAFIQADIFDVNYDALDFDFVWASPTCKGYCAMKSMHNAREHPMFVGETRELLKRLERPYALENVKGAPLIDPITLCGTQFGLHDHEFELQRHRPIETSFPMFHLQCRHERPVLGVYGDHVRDRRRRPGSHARGLADPPVDQAKRLMGIDWMTLKELSQAIPPPYSEFIGREALRQMGTD